MAKVSMDDLLGAAEWLESYDVMDDEDPEEHWSRKVAAMLIRMHDDRYARSLARTQGLPYDVVRQHMREWRREQEEG